jgi:hypothetical protein
MKIKSRSDAGNVLVISIVTCMLMGMGLASYLTLVQSQNRMVMRSRTWNAAIPVAEAGIEEALTHLNVCGDSNRATNGWSWIDQQFVISRTFDNFRYSVGLDSSNQPIIFSTGYVQNAQGVREVSRIVRVATTRFRSGMRGMIALQNITMNGQTEADSFDSEDPKFNTNGRYDPNLRKDGSYVGSVHGSLDTGGGQVLGTVATGPKGNVSANAGDFQWLSSQRGIQPGHYENDLNLSFPAAEVPFKGGASYPETAVTVVRTNIADTLSQITTNVYPSPEPASGVTKSVSLYTTTTNPEGQKGVVTNTSFTSSKTTPAPGTYVGAVVTRVVTTGAKVSRGTWYDYARITGYSYPTTVYTYNLTSANVTTTTDNYNYVLRTGNYQMYSVTMSGDETMIVLGDAVLYVEGNFSMTGKSRLIIAPGASLKLYVGGPSAKFAGNGIMNENADATKFSYFGLPSNTELAFSGNASLTGSIYAPNADFTLNGGGNDVYDFVGASVTRSVAMHGHFNFHYDEALGRKGGRTLYRVASWNEI